MPDNDKSQGGENAAAQTPLDMLDMPLTVPAGRLDADQYAAEDLDGVTESVFGSGNMSFASLQAMQTDAALAANHFCITAGPDGDVDVSGGAGAASAASSAGDYFSNHQQGGNAGSGGNGSIISHGPMSAPTGS